MIIVLIVNITTIIVFLININILFGTKVALFFEGIVFLFIISGILFRHSLFTNCFFSSLVYSLLLKISIKNHHFYYWVTYIV